MTLPTISVIFPTYNRCDVVRRTLECLIACDYPHELVEIIVGDNSSDGTPEMVLEVAAGAPFPIHLQASDERLPAVKRNQGLAAATGELVVFLNDDVWVDPSFLAEHAAVHRAHEAPVAVVGLVEQSPEMPQDPFIEWYRPFAFDEIADRADQPVSYRYSWSMNLSLPRRVMVDRNLVFHENWAHIGHEDVELGYRWAKAGYDLIYNPRARGDHFHPHDLNSACRLQESVGRGLRDLEALIPEPDLLERYGVFSSRSSLRSIVRTGVRSVLFNRWTVPPLQRALASSGSPGRFAEWTYWKLMLHHTARGYRDEAPRSPQPTPTRPEPRLVDAS